MKQPTIAAMSDAGKRSWLVNGLLLAVFGVLIAFAFLYVRYQQFLQQPLAVPTDGLIYEFKSGSSLVSLANELRQLGVIEQPRFLTLLGRELDAAHRLQAGEYRLAPGMTPRILMQALIDGDVIQYSHTIIEGQTFRELMAAIRTNDAITATLEPGHDDEIMAVLGYPDEHPEGRFLPDTYFFTRGTTDVEFLQRAGAATDQQLAVAWQDREQDLPLENPYQALILASIVEKETGRTGERPRIAGVFVQRLRKGMRLQTDPTVIYGMGEAFDGNIRRRDLQIDTPYNTYTRSGLPPTPIAMPGIDAIQAVMHPDENGYLYFVSRGDGSHYFSRTLQEHNMAVKKYQLGQSHISLPESEQ